GRGPQAHHPPHHADHPALAPTSAKQPQILVRASFSSGHALMFARLSPADSTAQGAADVRMSLSSMTGFARGQGAVGAYSWVWETRSVNAKGLDLRLRLPPGWDAIEPVLRARAAEALARGTLHATLNVERGGAAPIVKVNDEVLQAVVATMKSLAGRVEAEPARLDGILSIKGVIEVTDADEREEERAAAQAAVTKGFDAALADLLRMRRHEGDVLGRVLGARLSEISALVARAEAAPGRKPEAIKARLAEQIGALLETPGRFEADRPHQ